MTRAATRTPLGAKVGEAVIARPDTLVGKKISLNLKTCKWFEPPTQDPRLHMDAHSPTVIVPHDVDLDDLKCIALKIRVKHVIVGDKPVPEYVQVPSVLKKHVRVIEEGFDWEYTQKYINKIFNGPTVDGGYRKQEIFEAMLQAETSKRDKGRKQVVKYLQDCIDIQARINGGTSVVRSEPAKDNDTSLSGYTPPKATDEDVDNFLNE